VQGGALDVFFAPEAEIEQAAIFEGLELTDRR